MSDITKDKLMEIFKEVLDEYQARIGEEVKVDKETMDTILDIVVKINKLPNKTCTSIAELIGYNPSVAYVEPLKQGEVSYIVKQICKKLNIKLEHEKRFGGLAYMCKFQKFFVK